jgi:hypothetical protein
VNYCRDCSHVYSETQFGGGELVFEDCPFCGSKNTGLAGDVLRSNGPHITDPTIPQRDAAEQARIASYGCKLSKGFSILNGGDL